MHVAYLSMDYPRDERSYHRIYERRLVMHLKDLCDIEILTWNNDPHARPYYLDGVKVSLIDIINYERTQRLYDSNRGLQAEVLDSVSDLIKVRNTWKVLRELHKRKSIDVIFVASFSHAAIYSLPFAKVHGIPICTQCTGFDVASLPEIDYGVRRKLSRAKFFSDISCNNVDLLLPNSDGIYQDTFLKDIKNKVKVLYQGANVEEFKPRPRPEKGSGQGIIVLNVGGLTKVKGWQDIVETAKLLQGTKIKFIIIGTDADFDEYSRLVSGYGLKNIRFLDRRPPSEVKEYLQRADIFFFPSLSEGLPNALLEASAMELPLIGSGLGGTKDIIIDDRNGYYIRDPDPRFFSEKIKYLAANPEERKRMGKAARANVIERFQWKMTAKNLIGILDGLVADGK